MTAPNVLLVEDSEFMSMRVVDALESNHEMELTAVRTASEARKSLKTDDFDVVVVNYELPDETGIEFAGSLNSSGTDPSIPIILLTGKKLEPIAGDAVNNGVTEFVYKGDHAAADMDVLANRIKTVIAAYGTTPA
jgi:two-component system sensor histidine kinase UhpB